MYVVDMYRVDMHSVNENSAKIRDWQLTEELPRHAPKSALHQKILRSCIVHYCETITAVAYSAQLQWVKELLRKQPALMKSQLVAL